jgi:HlyD family secretion protein
MSVDPYTGQPYYLARISISQEERARLGTKRLVPGMPAEVFLKTEDRTVLSYLAKPVFDQMSRAFRER